MAYQQDGGFQRQMYQGNWTCSQCGGAITELPFQPDESRLDQLTCRDCHAKQRGASPRRSGGRMGGGGGSFQRQMYQGSWACSQCGATITELPFQPDESRVGQLLCRDCHRQRNPRFSR